LGDGQHPRFFQGNLVGGVAANALGGPDPIAVCVDKSSGVHPVNGCEGGEEGGRRKEEGVRVLGT
jgi:hypothetical protein